METVSSTRVRRIDAHRPARNFMKKNLIRILLAAAFCQAGTQAAIVNIPMGGTTSTDEWTETALTAGSGYPGFPGNEPWPSGITANVGGGATLIKTGNGVGGGPFPAGSGIYFGGYSAEPNTFGGSLGVQDLTPLAGVQTIIFQIEIGESLGYDFVSPPMLSINGGGPITPTYSSLFDQQQIGIFDAPVVGPTPLFLNSYAFQWDVREFSASNFQIDFSAVQHATISGLRVDQSTIAYDDSILPAPIPEPSAWALLGISATVLCYWMRFQRRTKSLSVRY